jgi:hypothetical protein
MRKDVIFCKNSNFASFYTLKKMTSLDYILFIIGISTFLWLVVNKQMNIQV